jgi:hypothetical protein
LLSILFGSVACVTRLEDFRLTASVVRHRDDQSHSEKVARWREHSGRYGEWTWKLFALQLLAFGLQSIGLLLAIGITYWHRLT